jgi:hypothetical protein
MELISSTTVGVGGASTIVFSSIPATYTDLKLVLSARATSTTPTMTIAFNGSSASFTNIYLQGNGSGVTSASSATFIGNASISTDSTSTFGNLEIYIANYANASTKYFSVDAVSENNSTTAFQHPVAGLWSNTAAITQVTLSLANFAQNTTAYLYGILKGSGGATAA